MADSVFGPTGTGTTPETPEDSTEGLNKFAGGLSGSLAGVKGSVLTPDSGPKFPTPEENAKSLGSMLGPMTDTPEKLINFTAFISALKKITG